MNKDFLAEQLVRPKGIIASRCTNMDLNDLTYQINGAIFEVNRVLGVGFLEKVYENALLIELRKRGLTAECQVSIKVKYKDKEVGEYYADTKP